MKCTMKKVFAIILAAVMLVGTLPVFATTVKTGNNGKTINFSFEFYNEDDELLTAVEENEFFLMHINFSGNPSVADDSIQGYNLLISYDADKVSFPDGDNSFEAGVHTPSQMTVGYTPNVVLVQGVANGGILKRGAVVTSGTLFKIYMTAKTALTQKDLNGMALIASTGVSGKEDTYIIDGHVPTAGEFSIAQELPEIVEPPKEDFNLTLADKTVTYDGTAKALEVSGVVPAGATVEYTSADFDEDGKAIDAGTYNIKATVKKDGYNDWSQEATLTINPKPVSVTGLTVANKVYDGTNEATLSGGTISGIVARDSAEQYCDEHQGYRIKYYIPEFGTFADANAGTNKAVSIAEIRLTGCSAENYVLTQPSGLKANITQAPITVKAKDVTVRVGSAVPVFDENSYEIISGKLLENDKITGTLATDCTSTSVAKDFSITKGTLTAGSNYNLTFVAGKLSVIDKTAQTIAVDGVVTEKTYGDDGFKITVTPDETSKLDNFTMTSSNENVASIDASGNVTIKNAGTTTISVKEAGNAEYAAFEKSWTLTVKKLPLTVTADNKTKKVGQADPRLTHQLTGKLIGLDVLEVTLVREQGETAGRYAINKKKIVVSDNYDVTFVPGVFEILEKTPQTIAVDGVVTEKTYGDDGFKITVTPDETSKLDNFTMTSSNENVASIDVSGNVTIKNAGTTTISVKEAGNDEYAAFEKTWTLTVNKAKITITADNISKKIGQSDPELTYQVTGKLFGEDKISGKLSRTAGETVGRYDILVGTLAINDNYEVTFNKGVFEILEKTPQIVAVDGVVAEKTYGDDGFKITVTPDETSKLDNFTMTSSNENVASIDESGNVIIKGAGTTTISVKEAGNDEYAAFEKTWTLTVNKAKITITADNISKKIGQSDPELTYQVTGKLFGEDKISGELSRTAGETVGRYDILVGTLAINDNYEVTFNKGVFEILEKTPQSIAVADVAAKTYGDASFKLEVTPDEASKLDAFTYASSDANVADVAVDGTVTIKGVGETVVTVSQAGNEEYAAAEKTVKIVVNPATITVVAIDMENKTATLEGVFDADKDFVALDFDNVKTTVLSLEKETTTVVSTIKVTNFTFTGEKAKNYAAAADAYLTTTVSSAIVEDALTEDENVTIEAAPAGDKTIIVTDVAIAPEAEVKTVAIDITSIADTKVNTVAFPKATVDTIVGIDPEVELELVLKDGSDENKESSIVLNAQALAAIQTAGSTATTIAVSVDKTEKAELSTQQATKFEEVSTKTPVVYSLTITDETGASLAANFGAGGKATVKLPYAKPDGNNAIIVKHLDNLGNLTNISNPRYDALNQVVIVELAHFSEYLIYTEPVVSYGGGGGGSASSVVRFETNGGSKISSQTVKKGELAIKPDAPVKEGYIFEGWYTDKELTIAYDFSAKVTKSVILYAKWTEIEKEADTSIAFADVTEDDWFYANVKYAVENKLMNGVSADKFAPNDTLTRAMLVTVLYRNAGEPATNRSIPFGDIDMGAYYANAVSWAKQNGIVNGVTENEFAPDNNITREQIAAIMFRYAQLNGMDAVTLEDNLHFEDAGEISEYAVSAMNWAVGSGLMNGKSATTINPKDNATRAEIAAILQRFIESNK